MIYLYFTVTTLRKDNVFFNIKFGSFQGGAHDWKFMEQMLSYFSLYSKTQLHD